MNWDLVWAVAVVGVVAWVCYGAGWISGFKAGVTAMHDRVVKVLEEEKEKLDNEREKTP